TMETELLLKQFGKTRTPTCTPWAIREAETENLQPGLVEYFATYRQPRSSLLAARWTSKLHQHGRSNAMAARRIPGRLVASMDNSV
ncbi:hypothetical protein BGX27_003206, partial [Mortierella sp. AM989]